jgi:predicted RNA binding protein YcfA (HicA-like mRNA interferase family)
VTKKSRDIAGALTRKGFVENADRDHRYYHLWYENRKTQIYTKISHSSDNIDDHLFSRMARQVKLTTKQFGTFVNCCMDGAAYVKAMIDNGHVTSDPPKK